MTTTPVRPFQLRLPDDVLTDLRRRLAATRWPSTVGDGWDDGIPLEYTKSLADTWATTFDFRAFEARINAWPNYTTRIALADKGAVDLHFIHARSRRPDAMPLLLIHGWPGSVVEFLGVIDALTAPPDDASPAFHVVAISLPGYGLSSAPTAPGWGVAAIADALNELMTVHLAYPAYNVQGGDWGAIIGAALARRHGGQVRAFHCNMPVAGPTLRQPFSLLQAAAAAAVHKLGAPAWVATPLFMTAAELEGLGSANNYFTKESGYAAIQSTRPRTLGYGLTDSPAGLLAWIVEKFYAWSDRRAAEAALPADAPPGAAVDAIFTRDVLLSNATLYWCGRGDAGTIASSIRLYKETALQKEVATIILNAPYCRVPTAGLIAPRELFRPPRAWVAAGARVVRWTELEAGGHFLALEQPRAFVQDVRAFFGEWGRGAGV